MPADGIDLTPLVVLTVIASALAGPEWPASSAT
jgi:hypothetical protein